MPHALASTLAPLALGIPVLCAGCTERVNTAPSAAVSAAPPAASPSAPTSAAAPASTHRARPEGPFAKACEGPSIDLTWALDASRCRASERARGDPRAPWPAQLRLEVAAPPGPVAPGATAELEVFFHNSGEAPVELTFELPARDPKSAPNAAGVRLNGYPLRARGGRLDMPSAIIGAIRGRAEQQATITLAAGGWARAIGEVKAQGFTPDPKAQFGEKLAPLPPGRYGVGVETQLGFTSPPAIDAFIEVR